MKFLKERGYLVEGTERWNHFTKTKHDLFGFIDLIALGKHTIGVQATTAHHMSARISKIEAGKRTTVGSGENKKSVNIDTASPWIMAGNALWVIGWVKPKKTGKWEPRIKSAYLFDGKIHWEDIDATQFFALPG